MKELLVSVPVITYNSSSYIIEGLESIKAQTYKNIELVISDDCSTDNTVEICQKWLDENGSRFVRTILVTTDKNTGVAGNLNRAIRNARGEWIKTLSGDDKFRPETIQSYIAYIIEHPNCNICFARMALFGDDESISRIRPYYFHMFDEIKNPKNQYDRYLKHHYVPGPGLFFKKSLWEKVGGYNEKYQFCEEFPFTLNILKQVEYIHFIDSELYLYNVRRDSLSNGEKPVWRNFKDQWQFYKDIKFKEIIRRGYIINAYDELTYFLFNKAKFFSNSSNLKIILAIILRYTSPLVIYHKLFAKQ